MKTAIIAYVMICPQIWQKVLYERAIPANHGVGFQTQRFAEDCKMINGEFHIKERVTPGIMKVGYWPDDWIEPDENGTEIWRGREQEGYALLSEFQPKPLIDTTTKAYQEREKRLEAQRKRNKVVQDKWRLPRTVFVIDE